MSGSQHSITEAERDRAQKSDVKGASGAAGARMSMSRLEREPVTIAAPDGAIEIDFSWDHHHHGKGVFGALLNAFGQGRVDLDLGCLYELQDGKKGCLQAFGNLYGSYDTAPFIHHSGDERTGAAHGVDESIVVNGAHWADIKRVLVYAYIYKGAPDWQALKPELTLRCGGTDILMCLEEDRDHLPICALVTLENANGAITLTRRGEYFHGHPELDRAYGFGLNWQEGEK